LGIYEKIGKGLPHNVETVVWRGNDRRQVNIGSGLVADGTTTKEIEAIVTSDERGDPNKQMFIVRDDLATVKVGHQFVRNEMTYEVMSVMTEWLQQEKLHICNTEHLR